MPKPKSKSTPNFSKLRSASYASIFFLSINTAFTSYIDSNFLQSIVGENYVGLIFSISSILTILALFTAPFIVRHMGVVRSSTTLSAMIVTALAILIFSQNQLVLLGTWLLFYILGTVVRYNMDLYLEHITENHITGNIRGLFLTIINTGWLVSPLLASLLLTRVGSFKVVYLVSALVMIPFILFGLFVLRENHEIGKTVSLRRIWLECKSLFRTKTNAGLILITDFCLNFFYAIMIIFMPLYLKNYVGLSWEQIGLALTITLIPFVTIQLPLGRLADSWIGEKELLVGGFIIMAFTTLVISQLTTVDLLVWSVWLFLSRIGAATVEVMKETALFKHISSDNTAILSLSRMNVPLSFLAGSAVAALIIPRFGYQYLFTFLAICMLISTIPALLLRDSR